MLDHIGGGFTGFVLQGFGKKSSTVGDMKCLTSELGKPMILKKKHNFWYYLHLEKKCVTVAAIELLIKTFGPL